MKKEELLSLGIDEEVAKKILEINGKDIEKQKANTDKVVQEKDTLVAELDGVKTQLTEANTQIQSFKDMDIEGIKKSADEWKTKHQADTEALKTQMEQMKYDSATKEYLSKYEFTSEFAKKSFMNEFKAKEFKIENDKFLGADDFIEEFKKSNEGVFKVEAAAGQQQEVQQPNPTYTYKPLGGSGGNVDLQTTALNAVLGK